jgi:hypothetical protein
MPSGEGRPRFTTILPILFGAATTWMPSLNALSAAITPAGSVAAPLDAASIIGTYSGGAHLAGLGMEIYDSAGTTLRDSVLLSNRLLSDEVLTLDYKGKIVQTYWDDFAASTRWTQDAVNDGCTHGSGKGSSLFQVANLKISRNETRARIKKSVCMRNEFSIRIKGLDSRGFSAPAIPTRNSEEPNDSSLTAPYGTTPMKRRLLCPRSNRKT